jgi:uncharacterized protein YaiI (UPF0178 family)
VRIDELALQCLNAKGALVSPAQRFFEHENLERLNAERELAADKRSIRSQVARAKQVQILGNKYSGP